MKTESDCSPIPLPPAARQFIPRVESMRGLGALMVACYHSMMLVPVGGTDWVRGLRWTDIEGISTALVKLLLLFWNGPAAVVLFFVISGLVLGMSLDKTHYPLAAHWAAFLIRRVCRIYPALIVSTCVIAIGLPFLEFRMEPIGTRFFNFFFLHEPINSQVLISNLLLQRSDINPVSWTIQVELYASFLLPLFHFVSRKDNGKYDIPVLAILILVAYAFADIPICKWFFVFYLGLMLPNWGPVFCGSRRGSRTWSWMLLTAAIVTWLGASYAPYEWYGSRPFLVDLYAQDPLFAVIQGIGAAVLIGMIVYGRDFPAYKVLDFRVVRFYGRISYSFYLFHFVIVCALALLVMRSVSPTILIPDAISIQLALLVVSVALTTPIAFLSYVVVEKNFISLGKRLEKMLFRENQPKVEPTYVKG